MGFVITLLLLGISILVHELGHFLVMRRNGIRVLEFSLGFGPKIISRAGKGGTVYSLRALPLGGYVMPQASGPGSMVEARPWVKFKIAVAGPLMNTLLGWLALFVLFYSGGTSPLLDHEWLAWAPVFLRPLLLSLAISFGLSLATPAIVAYMAVSRFTAFLGGMAGPIGVFQMGSNIGSDGDAFGWSAVLGTLFFVWLINIGIAGFNLMPLHPLDGGHCVAAVLEKFGARLDGPVIKWFRRITAAVMIALVILVCTADFLRLGGVSLS